MTVSIVVDIRNKIENEIGEIRTELQTLSDDLTVDLDVKTKGVQVAEAKKQKLAQDTHSLHHVQLVTHGKAGELNSSQISNVVDPNGNASRRFRGGFSMPDNAGAMMDGVFGGRGRGSSMGKTVQKARKAKKATSLLREAFDDLAGDNDKRKEAFEKVSVGLRRAIPSYRKWIGLISLLIPLLITFGVTLAGVAVSMGAIVGAGAGLVGLGLIGHGNDMASAFENAKQTLGDFKKELFETFQPTAKAFAPFSDRFMETAPERMLPLAEAMKDLTAFESAVDNAFDGLISWLAEGITLLSDYAATMDALSQTFGQKLGAGILNFISWATEEAHQNQQTMIDLGQALVAILAIVYNLSKMFASLVVALKPLLEGLALLTHHLSNPLGAALLAFILTLYTATKAVYALSKAQKVLAGSAVVNSLVNAGGAVGYIGNAAAVAATKVWGLVAGLTAAQVATGIGILGLLVGGAAAVGMASGQKGRRAPAASYDSGSQTSSTNITFNVNGSVDESTQRRLVQKIERVHGRASGVPERRNMTNG